MTTDDRLELQKRLLINKDNLAELQTIAAKYGFDKPLKLVNDIKHERQQIAILKPRFVQLTQTELDAFNAMLQVLPNYHASKWIFSKVASIISDVEEVNDATLSLLIKGVDNTCLRQIKRLGKDIAEFEDL